MYDVFIKWNETMNQKRKKRELVYLLDFKAKKQFIDGKSWGVSEVMITLRLGDPRCQTESIHPKIEIF